MRRRTRRHALTNIRLNLGQAWLDKQVHPTMRPDLALTVARNVRTNDGVLEDRPAKRKLSLLGDATAAGGSWTFGADTKYASIAAATHLQIPVGGFALRISFTAVRPAGGDTAFLVSSRVNGVAHHVLQVTLSDAGVLTATWRSEGGTTHTATSSALDAASETHALVVYDPVAGTWTIYIDGVTSGTPKTGIAQGERPLDDATAWHIGAHYDPAVVGVVADTHFDGAIDSVTLFAFRGAALTTGSRSLLYWLRRTTWQQWPNPESAMVLAAYDCDESSGTTLIDHSRHKNDGVLVGGPSASPALVYPSQNGNWVGTLQEANGELENLVVVGGRLFHETVRAGSS